MEQNLPLFLMSSPLCTRSGYGSHSRDLARAVIRAYSDKYEIKFISTKWGSCPLDAIKSDRDQDIISRLQFGPIQKRPAVFIQVTIPNEFQNVGDINIGITAGVETTACDAKW